MKAGVLLVLLLTAQDAAAQDVHRLVENGHIIVAGTAADLEKGRIAMGRAVTSFTRSTAIAPTAAAVVVLRGDAPGRLGEIADSLETEAVTVYRARTDVAQGGANDAPDPAAERARQRLNAAMARLRGSMSTMQHEICHSLVLAHADAAAAGRTGEKARRANPATAPADGTARSRHYGHEDVPDWAEEAIAISCEDAAQLDRRRAQFSQQVEQRIPLREFLSMPHPAAAISANAPARGATGDGDRRQDVQAAAAAVLAGADAASLFYSQALSLGEFLNACRPGLLLDFALATRDGRPVADLLRACGLPADIDALEQAWIRSVR